VAPARWLLLWLPLFRGALIRLWSSLDPGDDPASIEAAIVFAPFWLVNVIVTLALIAVVLSDLHRGPGRGYPTANDSGGHAAAWTTEIHYRAGSARTGWLSAQTCQSLSRLILRE
jgi:hypothetical protein